MQIFPASTADARAVAEIHVATWRAAYKCIIPADYLAGLSVDEREIFWREAISLGKTELAVAKEGAEVLGWVNFGACRDEDVSPNVAEIWAIYVSPQHWSKGVGRLLWHHTQSRLAKGDFETVSLWVLEANARAIHFYLKAGFMPEASSGKEFFLGGERMREVRYVAHLPLPSHIFETVPDADRDLV